MTLTPTEQQAVKEAAEGYAGDGDYQEWLKREPFGQESNYSATMRHFNAGVSFALSTLFEPRCVAFHDWVRDNTVADGAPKLLYKLDSKRYTTSELYSIYYEQLNKQQDGK